jgi:membrane-associated phospholipid phosphatase
MQRISADTVAKLISTIASPPIVGMIAISIAAAAIPSPAASLWAVIYTFTTILIPSLYVVLLIRQGKAQDFHLNHHNERIRPTLFTMGCNLLTLCLLYLFDAPTMVQLIGTILAIQTVLFSLITLRWKISAHSATSTGTALLAWWLLGDDYLIALIAPPMVIWSRLYLRRHTHAQVVAGALLGALIIWVLWLLGY